MLRTPQDGSTIDLSVKGALWVAGTATDDDSGVDYVEADLDGASLGRGTLEIVGAARSFEMNTVPSDGPHSLTVRAVDRAGNTTTIHRTVMVTSPGDYIPSVDLNIEGSASVEALLLSATTTSLTLTASSSPVAVGDVIALGISPVTPAGALRRIVAVQAEGTQVVLVTRAASLAEAFWELHLDEAVKIADAEPATLLGRAASSASRVAPVAADADASTQLEIGVTVADELCVNQSRDVVDCDSEDKFGTVSASADLTYTAESSLGVDVDVSILRGRIESFSTMYSDHRSLEASTNVSGGLKWESNEVSKTFASPYAAFMVGPVPVIIQAELELHASMKWKLDAEGQVSARVEGGFDIGASYTAEDGWDGVADPTFTATTEAGASLDGELQATVGTELFVQFYELAGPTATIDFTPILTGALNTDASPGLGVDLQVDAGIGAKAQFLSYELASWSEPNLLNKRFNLAYFGGHTYLPLDGRAVDVKPHPLRHEIRAELNANEGDRVRLVLDGWNEGDAMSVWDPRDATIVLAGPDGIEPEVGVSSGQVEFTAPANGRYTIGYRFENTKPDDAGTLAGVVLAAPMPLTANHAPVEFALVDGLGVAEATFSVPLEHEWSLTVDALDNTTGSVLVVASDASSQDVAIRDGSVSGTSNGGTYRVRVTGDSASAGRVRLGVTSSGPGILPSDGHNTLSADTSGNSYAIGSDRRVYAWGANGNESAGVGFWANLARPTPLVGMADIVSIATGPISIALDANGKVYQWEAHRTPRLVDTLPTIISIASGDYHVLALAADGTVFAWGLNSYGQIGNGTADDDQWLTEPYAVPGLSNAVSITAAGMTSAAVTEDGSVLVWGINWDGGLGVPLPEVPDNPYYPHQDNVTSPTRVSELPPVRAVSLGGSKFAITLNGDVWGWGYSSTGLLGLPVDAGIVGPRQIAGLDHIATIQSRGWMATAIRSDGTTLAWGKLSDMFRTQSLDFGRTPAPILGLPLTSEVVIGNYHVLARTRDGKVFGWGSEADSSLTGEWGLTGFVSVPVQIRIP